MIDGGDSLASLTCPHLQAANGSQQNGAAPGDVDTADAPPGGAQTGFVPLDGAGVVDFVAGKPHLADRLGGAATKDTWQVGLQKMPPVFVTPQSSSRLSLLHALDNRGSVAGNASVVFTPWRQ